MLRKSNGSRCALHQRTFLYVIILLTLCFCLNSILLAQGPKLSTAPAAKVKEPAQAPQPNVPTPQMTAADIEAFLDGVMPIQLAREDIAGAVVLVVKDGKVLFAKGYGYSDVKKKTPISPDRTLFRPGSISKLFTWTAVMQLVEQGKLDLDRDVNDYLDFKIPAKFGKPITLRNIMTHTAGFEETAEAMMPPTVKDLKPLSWYVKTKLPQRIFPPGETPAYSNFATTLAGYIVERVSGEPFCDYVDHHIFNALDMTNSTFRQPLPTSFEPMMSSGYKVASEPSKPFELVQPWPAGSLSATASDMSHFMIAHLQDGQYEGKQILRPETARLMHARAFENLPSMNGMALGFYEESRNGHRIIGHGGDTMLFHSDLHLIPDAGVGFFISYNSGGKGEIDPRGAVWDKFVDRYFPYQPPAGETVASAAQDAQTVSGRYLVSRGFQTNIMRALIVLTDVKVYGNKDGTISIDQLRDLNGQPRHFREIAPLMFRDVNGQERVAFKRMSTGELRMVLDFPFMVFRKAHGSDDGLLMKILLGFSLTVMLLTIIAWPLGAWIRWHYGRKLLLGPERLWPRLITRLSCVFNVVLCAVVVTFAITLLQTLKEPGVAFKLLIHVSQLLGWLAVPGALVAVWNAYVTWTDQGRWIWSRIGYTLAALACLATSWFAITFHLLNLNVRY